MIVKVAKSCPSLCNPMDHMVRGILEARILGWIAIPSSRGSSQPRDRTQVSHIAGKARGGGWRNNVRGAVAVWPQEGLGKLYHVEGQEGRQ